MQIAAVAGGLTVVLYILKMRRRAVAVPFSKIWSRILRDKDATSLFSQLKRLLSLLLQLALLTGLIAALGDPRPAVNLIEGRNVVILLDGSASMKATDVQPTNPSPVRCGSRRGSAKNRAGCRAPIAFCSPRWTPRSLRCGDDDRRGVPELESAINQAIPTDARADFPRALRFAADTLRGLSHPEIVVVSDGVLGEAKDALGDVALGDIKLSFIPIGAHGKNAAISQFSVRRYPLDKSRYEVMSEVTNTSDEVMDVELSLLGDGEIVDLTRLRLQPKERLPRFYPNLSGASRTLEAVLKNADGTRDDLPADDHAYALLPERHRVKVQAVTEGNNYLEAALLLSEYLDVTYVEPSKYPAPGSFDVTIFDNCAPRYVEGSGGAMYFNPSGESSPVKIAKAPLKDFGFDEWDKKSPILRWMVLDAIGIGAGVELQPAEGDKVLGVSVDERSGRKRPFVVGGKRDGHRFLAVGFDSRDSDIVLRIAWPLLLLNTINDFVDEDVRYISSYRTGEIWHLPAADSEKVTLIGPDKSERQLTVQDGHAVLLGQTAGFYTLKSGKGANASETMFAANLSDLSESTIEPVKELAVSGKPAGEVSPFKVGVRRELWIYLLAAVLAISAAEWLTYHRRLTV
ncbi:MAG: BatA domain-containing protein [Polyangiaceae bacterium]